MSMPMPMPSAKIKIISKTHYLDVQQQQEPQGEPMSKRHFNNQSMNLEQQQSTLYGDNLDQQHQRKELSPEKQQLQQQIQHSRNLVPSKTDLPQNSHGSEIVEQSSRQSQLPNKQQQRQENQPVNQDLQQQSQNIANTSSSKVNNSKMVNNEGSASLTQTIPQQHQLQINNIQYTMSQLQPDILAQIFKIKIRKLYKVTQLCQICLLENDDQLISLQCGDTFHKDCLTLYTQSLIRDRNLNIICPRDKCCNINFQNEISFRNKAKVVNNQEDGFREYI